MNGVINITTKKAKDTQGLLVSGIEGNEEGPIASFRYGGKVDEHSYYRVYGKYLHRDDSFLPDGTSANDSWSMWRGGFRYDLEPDQQNLYTIQGDAYSGDLNQSVTVPTLSAPYSQVLQDKVNVVGANILSRWNHQFSESADLSFKAYYDHTRRDRVVFAERRDTFDLDLQHHFQLGDRQDIILGVGYNVTSDKLNNTFAVTFDPTRRTASLYSGFVQDEIQILRDKLRLTLGTKLEHNDYTGWELQPSGRLSWSITKKQTAWFAASRAVSTPSRAEDDIRINREVIAPGDPRNPTPLPILVSQFGSRDVDSKELIAFELGYRVQPHPRVTLDLATFYNLYDRQRSLEPGAPDPSAGTYIVQPFTINNLIYGETYGAELASNYTFWSIQLHKRANSNDPLLEGAEHDSPKNQFGLRSQMDLPHHLELDLGLRFVDSLSDPLRDVPSYFAFDSRIGWRPDPSWEFSLIGQNLNGRHKEFAPSYIQTQTTEVGPSVFGKITYHF